MPYMQQHMMKRASPMHNPKNWLTYVQFCRTKHFRTLFHQAADEIRWIVINHALSATQITLRRIVCEDDNIRRI
jgi:hypothetical protein